MSVQLELPLLAASFGLGFAHAFDPDHLAAVTALASERPQWRRAMRCAIHWALGHGLAVVTLGLVLLATPFGGILNGASADRLVGVALIALGSWTAWSSTRQRHTDHRVTAATASLFGILHGTAGVAAVLGLLGVARASVFVGLATLATFSTGVFTAMFALAVGMGSLYERLRPSPRIRTTVQVLAGLLTSIIGLSMLT